ncbi:MAG: hypothetical protein WBG81_10900, partial [Rhodanobacter sp.]
MPRLTEKQYRHRLTLAMTIYVGVMLLVWPLTRTADGLALKIALALTPLLPMLYVVWLLVRRVWHGDELEQRTHLLALGASTVAVGVLSLVGGFLAAARAVALDGAVLIWVFPALLIGYDATRWWVARRYGAGPSCDDEGGMPMYLRCLLGAALLGLLALLQHLRQH